MLNIIGNIIANWVYKSIVIRNWPLYKELSYKRVEI
jgi:hypothetical protein